MSSLTEAGIQLHLPTFNDYPLPQLLQMAQTAKAGGFAQVWVTDNLQQRNSFVVLSALAATVPIKLGTAVMVQYFHNPVDAADSVASITELMDGRELSIGIARGNQYTPHLMRTVKPISTLRETAQCLRALLAGEKVQFQDYPTLASYFNFVPETSFKLAFTPKAPVRLYCGGNGPLSLAVGGRFMDGIIFGATLLPDSRTGRLVELLETADQAARSAGRIEGLLKVAEIKISVSRDGEAAKEFVKSTVASRMFRLRQQGYTPDDFRNLSIEPGQIERMQEARDKGASREELSQLVTNGMIDAIFVAGDPGSCREKMAEVCAMARYHGFHQLMFSELGPDAGEALRFLCDEILPMVG